MSPEVGKFLMILGAVVLVIGAAAYFNLLPWLGKLPGDIAVKREGCSFYFPVVTCIVVSVALTLVMSLFRK